MLNSPDDLRAAARDLAQRIEAGNYGGVPAHERTDLHGLTLFLMGVADTYEDVVAERDEALCPTVRRALPPELQAMRRGVA